MAKIGFIGLGIMGKPMAQHLQNAGHQLFTSKHSQPPHKDLLDAGLTVLGTPKAVAAECETTIRMPRSP